MRRSIIEAYEKAAPALLPRYRAIDSAVLHSRVWHHFPKRPSEILDIGAGTGRDAAWLSGFGHRITALEPSAAFRAAGQQAHRGRGVTWINDHLPDLARVRHRRFDLLLICAVWHHLDPAERARSLIALRGTLRPGGRLILSMRQGPSAADRPGYPLSVRDTSAAARLAGFALVNAVATPARQEANRRAGVHWTWLVFRPCQPFRIRAAAGAK
ncbi:MAG: class I SAM-dependent methyltransferase [Sulfitobacter sp.]|nr:class I SAM-dependent methyltransferase [Sulfitobacter sp.]